MTDAEEQDVSASQSQEGKEEQLYQECIEPEVLDNATEDKPFEQVTYRAIIQVQLSFL